MNNLKDMLKEIGYTNCLNCTKYSPAGNAFYIDNEDYKGMYWYYETDSFIIDIHDFFIKREMIVDTFPDMRPYMSFISTYIITASGEWFNPYQNIVSNTMFVTNIDRANMRLLLHGNYPYFSVGINFKEKIIEECVIDNLKINKTKVSDLFLETREFITKPIEKLAKTILNCSMDLPSADLFFEAKAKEWLSITIDEYTKKSREHPLSESDKNAIENVSEYINDHYAFDIPQELLEKIAMMSGTKLKSAFKQKYQMSITEYTQRKRMNIAENLLLTTELEIKDIAKSVGYNSHSRFTALFKRYKGIYPKEVKQFGSKNPFPICCCENKK
ncbi:AraC family transcriptional regulator [Tissierella sp.]|uniref:helix-turn-helix transcriptional regulator n=1 Tax=Tissierella sp. TaxID=41274 RepID=UPI0028AE52D2|nr:AraC family transcriptional regulator [Tissierella sp.]